ncbi:MAG: choice-of-anchor I family protein [Acidobacteriota bacterium]
MPLRTLFICLLALAAALPFASSADAEGSIELNLIGRFATGVVDDSGAEIAAHDPATQRVFFTNAGDNQLLILDIRRPWAPTRIATVDLDAFGGGVNSVAVQGGLVAVALEGETAQMPGSVAFFNVNGVPLGSVAVGPLPDMLTFTPDGTKILVANEGEPLDYCDAGLAADPEGSISIITIEGLSGGAPVTSVQAADFSAFNGTIDPGVRIFGPGATVAQDLEPEFIAVAPDGQTAWITLQENNAVAVLDIASATITAVVPFGMKNHNTFRNGFDASNRDNAIRVRPWPVMGMYQPDAIAAYDWMGETYLVTANEGDARDYDCFSEEERIGDFSLDPDAFGVPAFFERDDNLGRLRITNVGVDTDDDGLLDRARAYGARSLSIWRGSDASLVWDSGNEIELITAGALGGNFNSNQESDSFDARSDDKGPEPEGVAVGRFNGRTYAFVGLERSGGIIVYDISDPTRPFYDTYINTQDFSADGIAGDVGPEGLIYIPREESPINRALVVVTFEISGTVGVFSVRVRDDGL